MVPDLNNDKFKQIIAGTTEYFYKIHNNGNSEYRQHFLFMLSNK